MAHQRRATQAVESASQQIPRRRRVRRRRGRKLRVEG
jgi:hypothetical protein